MLNLQNPCDSCPPGTQSRKAGENINKQPENCVQLEGMNKELYEQKDQISQNCVQGREDKGRKVSKGFTKKGVCKLSQGNHTENK